MRRQDLEQPARDYVSGEATAPLGRSQTLTHKLKGAVRWFLRPLLLYWLRILVTTKRSELQCTDTEEPHWYLPATGRKGWRGSCLIPATISMVSFIH